MIKNLLTILLVISSSVSIADNHTVTIPDKAGDFKNGIYHVGMWVNDVDAMITFLSDVSSLKVISRVQLPNGGERLFLSDARGQRLELLSSPGSIEPHTQYPLHPQGAYAGMAHISIEVDDVVATRAQLVEKGFEIIAQAPKDFADGYVTSEVDAHRVLFVKGPSSMSFEFFEIKKRE
jgi:catechol 2,3-dioxygenase-like lactoylglutathione lyase family enzyme